MSAASHVSSLAGSWYPGDPAALRDLLASVRERSEKRTGRFVRPGALGFIVPHAAPMYSGTVAASVYRHIRASGAARIIVLGFSHRRALPGIAVPAIEAYQTPLGEVRVDRETATRLSAIHPFHAVNESAVSDHSVEIQVPFLQVYAPETSIVPLYVGRLSVEERTTAAEALRNQLDGRTVLVASSDLTHYGHAFGYEPFDAARAENGGLRTLDLGALAASGSLSPPVLSDYIARTATTVCGAGPIELLLEVMRRVPEEVFMEMFDYETSGAITGNYQHSVSYGAVGFFPHSAFHLERDQQVALLASARYSLDQFRRHRARESREPADDALRQKGRVFVSLYENKQVRGCVGCFPAPHPLAASTARLAASAFEDRRFGAIENSGNLEVEIQILTPPKSLADLTKLKGGVHGAWLNSGNSEGLLLPIVAERYGLSRTQFLSELARKAGLPDSIYTGSDWQLSVFRVQRFAESDFNSTTS
ncbi:MAG: AmmeMemoRadiSam system protein B [Bryobacterales bacterium]|nr:AmmeMemoRadiSam system protein B [Bryobacterales bacterium]